MKYLLLILVLFTFSFADEHKEEHHHYYSKDLTYLDLGYEQQKNIKKLLKVYRKELKRYRKLKKHTIDSKQKLFEQENLDPETLIALDLELAQKAAKIEADFLTQIHHTLTKKQREFFIKHIDEWEVE